MSDADGGPGRREVAYRLFAAEFDDANLEYSESEEERAPNYVVTPTGARVNRLFVVGVLTEVESVSDDVLRGRVVDPTGAFVLYAGQYQQDERAFLDRADPPTFVAVTGKARTFQPDDSDRVFTSVRPESISEVDAETRDRWTVDAAEQTIERVEAMATAMALDASGDRLREALVNHGVEEDLADGIALALDHYGTTPAYLAAVRDLGLDAARLVTGEIEEVAGLTASPHDAGDVTVTDLLSEPVEPLADEATAADEPAESADVTQTAAEPEDASPETDEPAEPTSTETPSDPETATATAGASTDEETTEAAEADVSADETEPADSGEDVEGPGDFEPGEFDLDEAERKEVEEEFGTEFQTGTEIDEPGEADIETPEPQADSETEMDAEADAESTESEPTSEAGESAEAAEPAEPADVEEDADSAGAEEIEPAEEAEPAEESEPAEEVDLVDAVVSAMEELDEGDGAERADVVESVTERTGVDPEDVDDAIQDALMDGRCYEPDDETLKPI